MNNDCSWLTTLKNCLKIPRQKVDQKKASAPFQADIKFIFEGFNLDIKKCKGFKNSIRSLLVDNILKNMKFDASTDDDQVEENNVMQDIIDLAIDDEDSESYKERLAIVNQKIVKGNISQTVEKKNKNNENKEKDPNLDNEFNSTTLSGLPYMLEKKHFKNAFILHEESDSNKFLKEIMVNLKWNKSKILIQDLKNMSAKKEKDNSRQLLDASWASLKKAFLNQVCSGIIISFFFH